MPRTPPPAQPSLRPLSVLRRASGVCAWCTYRCLIYTSYRRDQRKAPLSQIYHNQTHLGRIAANVRPIVATDGVTWSSCWSSPSSFAAKTAETIEMPSGRQACVGARNRVGSHWRHLTNTTDRSAKFGLSLPLL